MNPQASMTGAEWAALGLQVVATLAEAAWTEVEAARVRVFEGHTVDPTP